MSAAVAPAWSAESTTPAEVEAALGELVEARHAEHGRYAPARVLNLVAVVDAARRDEVATRLERVGRHHPSRTVVCAIEEGRTELAAWATMACELPAGAGELALCREWIELRVGSRMVPALASVVEPLCVPDLETLLWAPHGHLEALEALGGLAASVLVDSGDGVAASDGLARAALLARRAHVVDLAWLRGAPWRERLAALVDPPRWRPVIDETSSVEVRHHPRSLASALLFVGWLADRLRWEVDPLRRATSADLAGTATSPGGEVAIGLCADPELGRPGLGGIGVGARSGHGLRLDRGVGGLAAWRRTEGGEESTWTILGASRGEGGVLGEGIRQALLRSSLYRPALERAVRMSS